MAIRPNGDGLEKKRLNGHQKRREVELWIQTTLELVKLEN